MNEIIPTNEVKAVSSNSAFTTGQNGHLYVDVNVVARKFKNYVDNTSQEQIMEDLLKTLAITAGFTLLYAIATEA